MGVKEAKEAKKEEVKEAKEVKKEELKEDKKEAKEEKKEELKEDKKEEVKDKVEDVKMEDVKEKKEEKKKEKKEEPKRISSRGRVRKQVKQYVCAAVPEEKELEVPDGIGIPLGEISNVTTRMGPIRSEDPILRKLHHILYPGQRCKKTIIKRSLRLFKGFGKNIDKETYSEKVHQKLSKIHMKELKVLCELLDIVITGLSKDDTIPLIVEFLFNPQPSGNPYRFHKKKKKTPPTQAKKSKKRKKQA